MTHDEAREALSEYALGLLEADEAESVAAHIRGCDDCEAEVREYLIAADALAIAAEPVELPAGMMERIASGVRAAVAEAEAAPEERIIMLPSRVVTAPQSDPWRRFALVAAAAFAVMAIGMGWSLFQWQDARDEADRLEGQLASRAIELPLAGDGATGTIFVRSDFAGGWAVIEGLGEAPNNHHYQVWSEGPDGFRAATDFKGEEGAVVVALPQLPADMTRMFVTVEPDGVTNATPSGPEVMSSPR